MYNDDMKNSAGFSIVEVLLFFVAIAIIGGTGFYVYRANKNANDAYNNASESEQTSRSQSDDEEDDLAVYSNSTYGYEFRYPQAWKTSNAANQRGTIPGQPERSSITLESSDLATSNEGVGFHLTSGAEMFVNVKDTDQADAQAHIQANAFYNTFAQNRENLTVAGQPALRYKMHHEGSPSLETLVVRGGRTYTIIFSYADDAAFQKYIRDYENLVKTFKLY